MKGKRIGSIRTYVNSILRDYYSWETETRPWFRGEPISDTPLLPKLYRPNPDGSNYNENRIVQDFRRMAPSLVQDFTPARSDIDLWLFLMQHVGVPTRLLDWTEGAFIALYFALTEKKPVVWMLNPVELNKLSAGSNIPENAFPLTWFRPPDGSINIGTENIRAAWELGKTPIDLPVAIKPTYIHPRMNAQKSCFTAHGTLKKSLSEIVPSSILKKYVIMPSKKAKLSKELALFGITASNIFPDLDGLGQELRLSPVHVR